MENKELSERLNKFVIDNDLDKTEENLVELANLIDATIFMVVKDIITKLKSDWLPDEEHNKV